MDLWFKKYPPCKFSFKKTYLDKLLRYADLVDCELKFAIYWAAWNLWALVCPSQLECSEGKCSITLGKAMQLNEMETIGDYSVGTITPLVLRIVANKRKPRTVEKDGMVRFMIGEIQLLCGKKIVTDKTEKEYAFYFMLYGNWQSNEPLADIVDNKLVHIDHVAEPVERTSGQGFELLGFISSMISRRYRALISTSSDGEKIGIGLEPDSLGVNIPMNYKGKALPLWRLHIRPISERVNK